MDDKELADKAAVLLIPTGNVSTCAPEYGIGTGEVWHWMSAYRFVRDWRVAGECLRSWPTIINVEQLDMTLDEMLRDPRAIIEARVQASERRGQ